MKKKIILTGASGFIGQRLLAHLEDRYDVISVSLQKTSVELLDFKDVDIVVHLAGKAHQMQPIPDDLYFEINSRLTQKLAFFAKKAGVSHFIFTSTIKVYGDNTAMETLTLDTVCRPSDPYGQSKYEAENELLAMQDEAFKVSLVRLPLVFGAGVKGNLWQLLRLTDSPYPLPFKGINNHRSMIYLGNLVFFMERLMETRQSGIFLPADSPAFSTSELIGLMRTSMGRPERLFTLPKIILYLFNKIKPALSIRLFGSLAIDGVTTYKAVHFIPPFSSKEGVEDMVNWYKTIKKH